MPLKDVMNHDVEMIHPEATLQEAALRMRARRISSVLVRDGGQFVGILTERDIVVRAAADGRHPTTTKVRDVMTPEIFWCGEDDDVMAAVKFMQEKQIRHLAVFNHSQQLVGIVSLLALAVHLGDETLTGAAIRWPA